MRDDLKVGVFLCECGGNISDIIDLDEVRDSLDVEFIGQFENLCSLNGRKIIRDAIFDHDLDRVVIAACSPISHEKTFQDYVKPLNPYLMDMANIREQCSWVHSDKKKATHKAVTLIKASIEKVKQSDAVDPIYCQTPDEVAVIGGGIAGMNAALSLAKQGTKVTLIEQSPSIGGHMAKIGKVFSPVKIAEECGMCLLNPILNELVWNENITVLTNSKVIESERRAGTYNLIVEKSPRYVDTERCIACGNCAQVCEVDVADDWNDGLSTRKAIEEIPFAIKRKRGGFVLVKRARTEVVLAPFNEIHLLGGIFYKVYACIYLFNCRFVNCHCTNISLHRHYNLYASTCQ